MTRAYVGLGANVGDRDSALRRAVELLRTEPRIEVAAVSSIRETEPWGLTGQPKFLNAAVALDTALDVRALLDVLLRIERDLGRTREGPRYGPRVIDLDLLLFGDAIVDEPDLQVPHPRLHERRFALEPLAELDPTLEVPGAGRVQALLAALR